MAKLNKEISHATQSLFPRPRMPYVSTPLPSLSPRTSPPSRRLPDCWALYVTCHCGPFLSLWVLSFVLGRLTSSFSLTPPVPLSPWQTHPFDTNAAQEFLSSLLIPPSLCGQSHPYSLASVSSPSLLLLTGRLPYLATGKTTPPGVLLLEQILIKHHCVPDTGCGGAVDSLSSNQPSSICCFCSWITKFKKWHHHLARNLCLYWKKK